VSKWPPEDKEQHREWNQIWPITFHIPSGKAATRSAEIVLSEEEKKAMKKHAREAGNLAHRNLQLQLQSCPRVCNAAVVVDPETDQVVAVGQDETLGWVLPNGSHRNNPLRHAAMVACENVAKRILRLFPDAGTSRRALNNNNNKNNNVNEKNTSEEKQLQSPVKKRLCQEDHRNHHPMTVSKAKEEEETNTHTQSVSGGGHSSQSQSASAINRKEPYLCTGLDCYLWQEPCIMCAMALVHSRIRRIIYCIPDKEAGVLGGSYRLHSLSQLNHHYEVFHQPYDG
jgi:tRNA-specific adenosine deaminase 3